MSEERPADLTEGDLDAGYGIEGALDELLDAYRQLAEACKLSNGPHYPAVVAKRDELAAFIRGPLPLALYFGTVEPSSDVEARVEKALAAP